MECPLCGHSKAHKHGLMTVGHQRYLCPTCHQTFSESFDSLYQLVAGFPSRVNLSESL